MIDLALVPHRNEQWRILAIAGAADDACALAVHDEGDEYVTWAMVPGDDRYVFVWGRYFHVRTCGTQAAAARLGLESLIERAGEDAPLRWL